MKKLILVCCVMFLGMNSLHAAKLAEREELKRQLLSVDTGMNDLCVGHMYPFILEFSGTDVDPRSLPTLFQIAQDDLLAYIFSDKTGQEARSFSMTIQSKFEKFIPKLIRAILPNNQKEVNEVIDIYNQLLILERTEGKSDL